jgi:hypothetical protein
MTALVSGAVRMEHLPPDDLLVMPSLNGMRSELFSNLILVNGRPFALLVNTDALVRARQELGN